MDAFPIFAEMTLLFLLATRIASLPRIQTQCAVKTAREVHIKHSLIHHLENLGYCRPITITVQTAADQSVGLAQGAVADLVLVPFADAASKAADRLLRQVTPRIGQ